MDLNAFAVTARKMGYPKTITFRSVADYVNRNTAATMWPTPEDWDTVRIDGSDVVKYRLREIAKAGYEWLTPALTKRSVVSGISSQY